MVIDLRSILRITPVDEQERAQVRSPVEEVQMATEGTVALALLNKAYR